MRVKNVIIKSDVYDEILKILKEFDDPQSIINFNSGCQLSFEKHSFVNSNNYMLVVLIIKNGMNTNLSITCGGASTGLLFKFDWGTEISTIEKYFNEIDMYLLSNEIDYEVLDDAKCE